MASTRKKPKRRGRKGHKKGARRSSAKRGAVATKKLRAGLVVERKPSKSSLKSRCLLAKPVGKSASGKKLYKLTSSKACKSNKAVSVSLKRAEAQARADLVAAGNKRPSKKEIQAAAKPLKQQIRDIAKWARARAPRGASKADVAKAEKDAIAKAMRASMSTSYGSYGRKSSIEDAVDQ